MALLPALLLGCPGSKELQDELIYVNDANNYSYTASVALGTIPTAISTDLTFRWDALSKDIQTHEVASCDEIDSVYLIWFQYLSIEELEAKIVCNDIDQNDATTISYLDPEEPEPSDCQALASETSALSNPFDPYTAYAYDFGTWFARVTTGTSSTRMMTALAPSADETSTDVSFENDSSSLSFEVDLHSLTVVTVPAQALSYTLDWSTLLNGANAEGCDPTDVYKADQLWLARYDDLSVDELEGQFLDLELVADEIWTADAGARTNVTLSDARSLTTGEAFTDFSAGGTWVFALRSTISENPAPLFLTVLSIE